MFLVTHKKAKAFVNDQKRDSLSNVLFYFYEDIENSFVVESGKQSISKNELKALALAINGNRNNLMGLFVQPNVELPLIILEKVENNLEVLVSNSYLDRASFDTVFHNIFVELISACKEADFFIRRMPQKNKTILYFII
ncbi:hypothetical protein CN689_01970 [Peribacillus butanolivorans]|uniref:Uncharacterized protein n=1 Tax=Peribacillus butanolivorans TaxID=421767 RepID=A0AAX0S7D5_9BACI|nr:hypothetical protein DTO10_23835 [Peribacillus butanolivorans]PEJ37686.1 hypothetical protein CN689_01970 [Peribacillus butanolivorans]